LIDGALLRLSDEEKNEGWISISMEAVDAVIKGIKAFWFVDGKSDQGDLCPSMIHRTPPSIPLLISEFLSIA
jgi:hypothetical protein